MLKKNFRLKNSTDINNVFKKGESKSNSLLLCKYVPNNLDYSRACFTLSKKLKLNAPERNRLKRQLSHSYTFIQAELSQKPKLHYDLVFILCKIPSLKISRTEQLRQNFKSITDKLYNV
jgi:ribonuclease P protein component